MIKNPTTKVELEKSLSELERLGDLEKLSVLKNLKLFIHDERVFKDFTEFCSKILDKRTLLSKLKYGLKRLVGKKED